MRLTLSLLILLTLTLGLLGCGSTSAKVSTRIDPATVALTDHFTTKLQGDTHSTKITIAPPAIVPLPIAQPVPATATAPSTPVSSSVTLTQAPTPVSVKVDGREISAPAGSAVSIELADTKTPAENTHDRSATAAGPTLRTDDNKGTFDASAPKVTLGDVTNTGLNGSGSDGGAGGATGGSTSSAWQNVMAAVASASSRVSFWLAAFGTLCLLAAVVMIIAEHVMGGATDWALVGILVGAGVLCIGFAFVADSYPWVIIILALLVLVGIVGYVLWWKFGKPSGAVVLSTAEADAAALRANVEALLKTPAPSPGLNVTQTTKS